MNEAETRAEPIDPALARAGWGVVEGSRIRREYPITHGRIEGRGEQGMYEPTQPSTICSSTVASLRLTPKASDANIDACCSSEAVLLAHITGRRK